jgi:hypothetical protein
MNDCEVSLWRTLEYQLDHRRQSLLRPFTLRFISTNTEAETKKPESSEFSCGVVPYQRLGVHLRAGAEGDRPSVIGWFDGNSSDLYDCHSCTSASRGSSRAEISLAKIRTSAGARGCHIACAKIRTTTCIGGPSNDLPFSAATACWTAATRAKGPMKCHPACPCTER